MKGKLAFACIVVAAITGCASTPPVKIGANTYYASKKNTAGIFGSVASVMGDLMVQGNKFCAAKQKQFQLVTQKTSPGYPGHFGGASITFKCVAHAGNPVMRKDDGVLTIKNH